MRSPKRKLVFLALCAAFLVRSSWGSVIGPVAAAAFNDSVDWCQFGCPTDPSFPWLSLGPSQTWISAGGYTGSIALSLGLPDANLVLAAQGINWSGNFPDKMGLMYNNACCGSTPDSILIAFDQALSGVGAYIQSDYPGDFLATVSLFDASYQLLGSYSTSGFSDNSTGGALFIGANSSDPVSYALFTATGSGGPGAEPDFAIGTMLLNTVPEPAPALLLAPALLGLVFVRRRFRNRARAGR